jgi:hypothetical protein
MELVDVEVKRVYTPGLGLVPLEVGQPLFHAVAGMKDGTRVVPACGQARRRLSPTFWLWSDPHHEGRARCPVCLELQPLPMVSGM